jgi:hypothetical protein
MQKWLGRTQVPFRFAPPPAGPRAGAFAREATKILSPLSSGTKDFIRTTSICTGKSASESLAIFYHSVVFYLDVVFAQSVVYHSA